MLGGLFAVKARERKIEQLNQSIMHQRDCTRDLNYATYAETNDEEMLFESIRDCFVTGKWQDNENAETLLADEGGLNVP